ncbi:MAG: RDD family protein [Candidatus Thioglobus sp.]|nr:MAG: RDD family protein [Candidatus Thioglobus sp.]
MKSDVSLLRRLGAIAYDIILAFSLAFSIVGAILIAFFDKEAQTDLLMFGIILITVYFYFTWSWVKGRQTLGMKTWKFQIQQNNGDNITHKQAFVRFVLAIISFAVVGLGFIYQLFNKDNLAWHDKYSKTRLIKN